MQHYSWSCRRCLFEITNTSLILKTRSFSCQGFISTDTAAELSAAGPTEHFIHSLFHHAIVHCPDEHKKTSLLATSAFFTLCLLDSVVRMCCAGSVQTFLWCAECSVSKASMELNF